MTQTAPLTGPAQMPLAALRESKTNPREVFIGMDDLADSIKRNGVLQRLIVRPLATAERKVTHEIVCGARRFRASRMATLTEIPVEIRLLSDDEADDVQQVENLQREDLTHLEEAGSFARMLAKAGQTIQSVATRVGKKPQYVAERLTLLKLTKEPRAALANDAIGIAHAIKIAALPEALQPEALKACFAQSWNQRGLLPVAELDKWIERNVLMTLATVPFSLASTALVPDAGSCEACTKRTGANTLLFPALADDACLDRACLKAKVDAHVQALQEQCPQLVRIATNSMITSKAGVLGSDDFVIIEPKKGSKRPEHRRCDHMRDGLVVQGHDAGRQPIVCAEPTCDIHHAKPDSSTRREEDYRAEQRAAERAKKLELATRRAIADAILHKFKIPAVAEWQFLTTSALHHLPHEYRIDVCKRAGCYPKTKQPGSMEMNTALAAHIATLDAAGCQRLLFDAAPLPLVRSQYRPEALAELKALGKRYRVDPAAIAKRVKADFAKKAKTRKSREAA